MFRTTVLAFIASLPVSACATSPGFDADPRLKAAQEQNATVVVAVTEMELPSGSAYRSQFFRDVGLVESTIANEDGFLGMSKRVEPFGRRAWTLTVWEDRGAMAQFMYSPDHAAAVERSRKEAWSARFVDFEMPASDLPAPWKEMLVKLDEKGRTRVSKGR